MKLTIWFKEIDGQFSYQHKIEIPRVTIFRLDNDLVRWETEYGLNAGTLVKNIRYYLLEDECEKTKQKPITEAKQVNPVSYLEMDQV